MKNLLLILLVCTPLLSTAQFEKGDKILGGSLTLFNNVQNQRDRTVKYSFYSITPSLGFFINEKVAVGGQLGYRFTSNRLNAPFTLNHSNLTSFYTGAFIRRIFPLSDKFMFSIDGNLSFSRQRNKNLVKNGHEPILTYSTHSYELGAKVTPSFLFLPSPRWVLEASFGSANLVYHRDLPDGFRTTRFYFNYGSISLGLFYFLQKQAD